MSSLLLIAYKFPPMQSISCNRTWALYTEFRNYFDHVYVISTSNRHILPQDDIDTSGAHIVDARTIDYRTLFQKKGRHAVASEKTKTSSFGKTASKLQSSFPALYLFGEGNLLYIHHARQAAEKLIRTHAITHLFSTFPPYADHVIAAHLKKAHPELIWIADYRDLHIDPAQENLFWRKYQYQVNRRILHSADLVTTVSEGLAEHLRDFHPQVRVLKNGVNMASPQISLFPKFTIAYTGSMFQDKRKPDTLLAAIRQLLDRKMLSTSEIDLVYAGKDSAVWWPLVEQYGLKSIFHDRGLLAKKEAGEIQQRSHINLLLTYSTGSLKGNLTGKLSDYLAAKRPILLLINGPADTEIESLVRETNAGAVVYHGDVSRVAEYLAQAYDQWKKTGHLQQKYNETALQKLLWPAILDTFMSQNAPILKF